MSLTFYTTLGCHLCEEAWELLQAWLAEHDVDVDVQAVEIASDPDLIDRYGIRIPVVAVGEDELQCPFDAAELNVFLTPRLHR